MTQNFPQHGAPCWYELGTSNLDAACAFYSQLFAWKIEKGVMPEFDYRLASHGTDKIAGLMSTAEQVGPPPPNWTIYFTVAHVDEAVAKVLAANGKVHVPATDIPGAGRFAVLGDPQGAVFGVLTLIDNPADGRAFNQQASGHGNWHELMTPDPVAAFEFYRSLLGWSAGEALDMGEQGKYQLFAHGGADIGGVMALGQSPMPCWMPYFGVDSVADSIAVIESSGCTLLYGPMEVPGPALVAGALDPQGAGFAIVGPKP